MPLYELMERGTVWLEMYRTAAIAEQKASREIAERNARRERLRAMLSGSGGRGRRR